MAVLVAYASRRGPTRLIARRIARTLSAAGQQAQVSPVSAAGHLAGYDAVVIGSAVRRGHWQPAAVEFVRRNRAVLAGLPVWLFSSGLPGSGRAARDPGLAAAEPAELAGLSQAIAARGHCAFAGMADAGGGGLAGWATRNLPVARAAWLAADRGEWAQVDAWAIGIASDPEVISRAAGSARAAGPLAGNQPGGPQPGGPQPGGPQLPGGGDARPALLAWAEVVDVSRLSDRTARAIDDYLRTYRRLSAPARQEISFRLVSVVTAQVSPPPPLSLAPLDVLATVLAARRTLEQGGDQGPDPRRRLT